jgi:hypothetical protein
MAVQRDFKELLAFFNEENVEYMIVGGLAQSLRKPRPG